MKSILNPIYNLVLPTIDAGDFDLIRRHKLYVNACLLSMSFGFSYGVMSYFIDFYMGMYTMALATVFYILCIWLIKWVPLNTMSFLVTLQIVLSHFALVYYSGGLFTSPVTPWVTISAPIMLMLTNLRLSRIILVLSVVSVLSFHFAIASGYEFPFTYNEKYHLPFLTLSLAGLVAIYYLVVYTFEVLKQDAFASLVKKQKELEAEQERSQNLLLNIFPADIAEELKHTGKTRARLHDDVTVLFADVKNFTSVSEGLSPDQLVDLLGTYFQRIDAIIYKHGLEKIKTIGDAYLAAAGVPANNVANAVNVVEAALEIQNTNNAFKKHQQEKGLPYFEFRIGINTGTVVAGVVGDKKYVYDIWGDAVNTAARIEEASEPGRINLSENTYQEVKEYFICEPRGLVSAKNKGQIQMYWVKEIESQIVA